MSSKLFVDPLDGNVGIGTTVPQAKLHVLGKDMYIGEHTEYASYVSNSSNVWPPSADGRINGVNITALNKRTRTSYASAVDCVRTWTARTSAADNNWQSVCWSSELSLFVAVAATGTGNRVMTSPDGITWTTRTSAADNNWRSVCWASELSLFVAVANTGAGNRVMTSPDGITWTARTSAADNDWFSVCWSSELSIFVAVASTGTGNRVMTSPDGITWTTRTSSADNSWYSVCWSSELSLFVAVGDIGTGNRVMTSAIGMPNSKSVVKALPSQMTVLPNGNVGIGTTNPYTKLHVVGDVIIGNTLSWTVVGLNSTGSDRSAIIQTIPFGAISSTNPIWSFGCRLNANADFSIWPYDGAHKANVVTIKPNGSFGIGIDNPQGLLHLAVAGTGGPNIRFQNASYQWNIGVGSSEFYVYNQNNFGAFIGWGGSSWNPNYSDERVKQDITPLHNALDVVTKLEPVTFKYKMDTTITHHGFIAQNIEKVIPSQIIERKVEENIKQYLNGENTVKTYDTEFLIPYLVKSIQELHAMVLELTDQINAIKK